MEYKKPSEIYDAFHTMADDQICAHCKKHINYHSRSPLGAVICENMPRNNCRPRWDQHQFKNKDGTPYLSIMEQIGTLACLTEEQGLDAYPTIMDSIRSLTARLSGRPLELIKPVEEWFFEDPSPKTALKKSKK